MFQSENHFTRVEANLVLKERSVLRQMIVEVTSVHQVQDETQLVCRLERVRHANDEWTSFLYTQTFHVNHIVKTEGNGLPSCTRRPFTLTT